MYFELEELISINDEIGGLLKELAKYEDGVNATYEDIRTDLRWNRYMLIDRLNSLKLKNNLQEE